MKTMENPVDATDIADKRQRLSVDFYLARNQKQLAVVASTTILSSAVVVAQGPVDRITEVAFPSGSVSLMLALIVSAIKYSAARNKLNNFDKNVVHAAVSD